MTGASKPPETLLTFEQALEKSDASRPSILIQIDTPEKRATRHANMRESMLDILPLIGLETPVSDAIGMQGVANDQSNLLLLTEQEWEQIFMFAAMPAAGISVRIVKKP